MIVGGVIQASMGVEAAGRDLEDIAPPLSATGAPLDEGGELEDPYTLSHEEGRKTTPAGASPPADGERAPNAEQPATSQDPLSRR
ncbi:MAG: hypothetical protein JO179_08530, partial [Solirubrobacterales bacterium]|nr:hypothetical protein [Solirubrobacterales bacterium]